MHVFNDFLKITLEFNNFLMDFDIIHLSEIFKLKCKFFKDLFWQEKYKLYVFQAHFDICKNNICVSLQVISLSLKT